MRAMETSPEDGHDYSISLFQEGERKFSGIRTDWFAEVGVTHLRYPVRKA
jgi:hypothetical protein